MCRQHIGEKKVTSAHEQCLLPVFSLHRADAATITKKAIQFGVASCEEVI